MKDPDHLDPSGAAVARSWSGDLPSVVRPSERFPVLQWALAPATHLLQELCAKFDATLHVRKGGRQAAASEPQAVRSLLTAREGGVELVAEGAESTRMLLAARALLEHPGHEVAPERGAAAVEGLAIGRAVVWSNEPPAAPSPESPSAEVARMRAAVDHAQRGVQTLIEALPRAEAELFEPEVLILEQLGPALVSLVGSGATSEGAVESLVGRAAAVDLVLDARQRLLEGLAGAGASLREVLAESAGDRILVVQHLTPSLVASLPSRVLGIVAASGTAGVPGAGFSSHAAILARGRGIPLALVQPLTAARARHDDAVIVDVTGAEALVWVAPDATALERAHLRHRTWRQARTVGAAEALGPLTHLDLEVHVNVGSLRDQIPGSADGIGLVRTELLHADRSTLPPLAEQLEALQAIAARAGGRPVVVRLFDAGGDKILPWLLAPPHRPGARGIELLRLHPAVLDGQLQVLVQAAQDADLKVLIPLVRGPEDVEQVRARSRGRLEVGALIETPEAVAAAGAIARASDFVCIGTNDLHAFLAGRGREDDTCTLDPRLVRLVAEVVRAAHAEGCPVTVCGELAADPLAARVFAGLGVDGLSVATSRFDQVKRELHRATRTECDGLAAEALGFTPTSR